jgi:hypothetical protein
VIRKAPNSRDQNEEQKFENPSEDNRTH